MTEYGLFNDEGLLEDQFYSKSAAEDAIRERYSDDEFVKVSEICHDHPEQPSFGCEDCEEGN